MNIGWKRLTTFSLLRLTRDYEDDILRRELFICDRNWGKTNPWLLFELWGGFNKAAFRDISLIKMSCKIWGWGNGWRTHNFSELQLNMWKWSPGTGKELSFCEQGVDWETLQWPRSQWERTGRLMWFWTEKQPLQKVCYTEASLPLSPFLGTILQPQVALSLDPQASKESSHWKSKDPKHSSFSQGTDHSSAHLRSLQLK